MPSLVESAIIVNSFSAGRSSVQDVFALPDSGSRLSIRLGIALNDDPSHSFGPERPARSFGLQDLLGEVRVEEHGKPLGLVYWVNRQGAPRSSPHFYESNVELACDFDISRLERFEDHRVGGEAIFWLSLWPTLDDGHGSIPAHIGVLRVVIPPNRWLEILGQLRGGLTELVEIPHPALAQPQFSNALAQLRDAKARVDRGDFDEAAVACRRALEGTATALNLTLTSEALESALAKLLDEERAKKVASIITRIREFGNKSAHRSEVSTGYLRADAQFVVACTAHAMALLSRLFSRVEAA